MEAIIIAGLWVVLSLIICALAEQKGHNIILWFLCSIAFSPALGFLVANFLEERAPAEVITLTRCPYCGSVLREEAGNCLRCHADFPEGVPRKLAA